MSSTDGGERIDDPSRAEVQESRRPTVLVAEDDDALRESYRRWLAIDDRFETVEAADGREALEKTTLDVDVLVLDRKMPNLSGPEVVDRLSERPFDGAVVIVSAFEPDGHLDQELVDDYVTKPIDREQLLAVLDRHA